MPQEAQTAIFSPKAKRLIETAMANSPYGAMHNIWYSWIEQNRLVRSEADTWTSAKSAVPFEVAMAAIGALEVFVTPKVVERGRASGADEDHLADLDTLISQVRSVEKFLLHAASECLV
jgi:hypothetical protein